MAPFIEPRHPPPLQQPRWLPRRYHAKAGLALSGGGYPRPDTWGVLLCHTLIRPAVCSASSSCAAADTGVLLSRQLRAGKDRAARTGKEARDVRPGKENSQACFRNDKRQLHQIIFTVPKGNTHLHVTELNPITFYLVVN